MSVPASKILNEISGVKTKNNLQPSFKNGKNKITRLGKLS